ncbi:MAG: hypothetical protein HDT27_09940 [Subdoligranulum sp.]|nr:hypothetical protein [Subdoligranulum sp.]MBD5102986.1 hypothetical protein [Subdoligranulum sp.]
MREEYYDMPDVCRNCGRPLADQDGDLCPACRAMEAAKAQYLKRENIKRPRRRRVNRTTRGMLVAVCVLAVLFLGLCTAATVLYETHRPDVFLSALDAALAAGDVRTVKGMLAGSDLAISDEGAAALCRAFADETRRAALYEQLSAQVVDPAASGQFPALRLVKTPVFFGYGDYTVSVHSVQLLLHSPARNLLLSLDGIPRTGEQVADGILYRNLFPGLYTCTVTGVTAAGQSVSSGGVELTLFSDAAPSLFDGALPIAAVTVSGCVNDEAIITVDGVAVAEKAVNGTVSLPEIAVGSTVGMQYTSPWGAVTTATAQFSDAANPALTFSDFVTQGGVPSAEELNSLLSICYATYFDAMNQRDASLLGGCTDAYRNAIAESVASDAHEGTLYIMGLAECSPAAIKSTTVDGAPYISCYAKCTYDQVDRETSEQTEEVSYAVCRFTWADGWKLNDLADSSEEAFNAASLDALP